METFQRNQRLSGVILVLVGGAMLLLPFLLNLEAASSFVPSAITPIVFGILLLSGRFANTRPSTSTTRTLEQRKRASRIGGVVLLASATILAALQWALALPEAALIFTYAAAVQAVFGVLMTTGRVY